MERKAYPTDVSDAEWAFVAPYLTLMNEEAPQREYSLREVFNGLRWMARAGEVVFLPQGKPHAFYIRSPHLRALILVQAVGEHAVGLDCYFTEMAEPAISMNLPTKAVTYIMDDPSHAIRLGAANGIRILSPEETAKELPHYPGFGANLEKIGH